jgi:murein L,D-transpeptidase YafK
MVRVFSLVCLMACGVQASEPPSSAVPVTAPSLEAPSVSGVPAPAPSGCVDTAVQLPGVAPAEPRLSAEHLVVVRKGARTVQLFRRGRAVAGKGLEGKACYKVGLGFAPEGHKTREGDGRTPEGWYRTSDKPWSSFYAAIAVHYPNAEDAAAGVKDGRITPAVAKRITSAVTQDHKPPQTTPLGGELLLHGGGSSTDWTLGCVALEDADIDALRAALPDDMSVDVHILP